MDQAEKLRQLMNNKEVDEKETEDLEKKKGAKVIAVTSGKGGVGKTNISINLAIHLSKMGHRVVILDADFALANIEVLFGITPQYSLEDVILGNKNIIEVMTDGPLNIKFISGGSGAQQLIKLDESQLNMFIDHLSLLDEYADVILVDTGAGISPSVLNFVKAAHEVLLVTTPEPTSIMDAYALIKTLGNQTKKEDIHIQLVVNRVETVKEGLDISNKIKMVSEKFLGLQIETVGYIFFDQSLVKAVKAQVPLAIQFPNSKASENIKDVAKKIINNKDVDYPGGMKNFIKRFVSMFSG